MVLLVSVVNNLERPNFTLARFAGIREPSIYCLLLPRLSYFFKKTLSYCGSHHIQLASNKHDIQSKKSKIRHVSEIRHM